MVQVAAVVEVLELVRDEPHVAAIAAGLRKKDDAGLVKGDVQIGAQQWRVGRVVERRCRARVVPRYSVGPPSV
jgi:hypothetical protein